MPLHRVAVTLFGDNLTAPMISETNQLVMFSFRGIVAGTMYIIGVVSARYGFEHQNQLVMLTDDTNTLVFRAGWQN